MKANANQSWRGGDDTVESRMGAGYRIEPPRMKAFSEARDEDEGKSAGISEKALGRLFEAARSAIIIVDTHGKMTLVNTKTEEFFGYEREEMLNRSLEMLLPERFRDGIGGVPGSYLSNMLTHQMGAEMEICGLKKDRTEFPVEIFLSPWDTGEQQLIVAIMRDVTARKQTQETMRQLNETLAAVFENAPDAIFVANAEGRMTRANSQAEALFGYKREELIGQPIEILLPERFRHSHVRHRAGYMAEPRMRKMGKGLDLYGLRKDGNEFPVDIMLSPMQTHEGRNVIAIVRDITQAREAEEALRKSHDELELRVRMRTAELHKANETLLEVVGAEQSRIGQDLHDGLCQHLTGIEFRTSVLVDRLADYPEARDEATKIAKLIREGIHQARMLARGLSPVHLESDGLMAALEELTSNTGKIFVVECRFECPQPVRVADHSVATHLYRIAQEAISNAVRHGRARSIVVALVKGNGTATLSITDDGCGILPHADDTAGMGLRIMRYRAEMIGANLQIGPVEGQGTAVRCTLRNDP